MLLPYTTTIPIDDAAAWTAHLDEHGFVVVTGIFCHIMLCAIAAPHLYIFPQV